MMSSHVRRAWVLVAVMAFLVPSAVAAQSGTITGEVIHQETGDPIAGAQISVQGTNLGSLSNANGQFTIQNVSAGTYTLLAQFLGYAQARLENVTVQSGQATEVELALRPSVLSLDGVVVAGTVDPVSGVRSPFSVGTVSRENLATVPTTQSALTAIQGKVAGANIVRNTGEPGTGVSIVLRSPTAITGTNSPLFVVDGVVLSSTIGGTTLDLESLDIENVEVIRGAAAASIYGSRAAGGVISITTNRGQRTSVDNTRIRVRNEFGRSSLATYEHLAFTHPYALTEDGTSWLDSDGNPTHLLGNRTVKADRVMNNPYPGPTYDNVKNTMTGDRFMTNSVEMTYNSQATNFLISANRFAEAGALADNDGYERGNFRVNLDHRLGDNFSISTSLAHTRSVRDRVTGSPFFHMIRTPPTVNLAARDENGRYLQQPDSTWNSENPLWRQNTREWYDRRARTLASGNARYNPTQWLTLQGTLAYDRADLSDEFYLPKGTPLSVTDEESVADGEVDNRNTRSDALSARASATAMRNFGGLTVRTTGRVVAEREQRINLRGRGRDLFVQDVPRIDVAEDQRSWTSILDIRSTGLSLATGLDYEGRYILDALVRHDGSSLFGADQRWQTYGRVAGAYRMAQESWWPAGLGAFTEFKPRYAYGTAGSRPGFSAQYETWSVGSTGTVSKNTLGNRDLRPSHTIEHEAGLDLILNNRYQIELTYARQETSDQIIQMTVPALTGYNTQWQNAGTMEGHTYEASFEAVVVQRPGLSWNTTFVADRSRSTITEWDRSCIGASNSLGEICEGRNLGQMLGYGFVRSVDDLSSDFDGRRHEFQVNDDGFVVWVGDGNTYQDGFSKDLWGSTTSVNGYPTTIRWGHPVLIQDEDGFLDPKVEIGDSNPAFQLGWLNNVNWRGLAIHSHLHSQIGGDTYNNTRRAMYGTFRHSDLDQTGKERGLQKPVDYYSIGLGSGNWFVNEEFVEDASYLKLRALSVQYRFNQGQLARVGLDRFAENLSLGLIGRNLMTLSRYRGLDPEVGGVFFRVDQWYYPPARQLTAVAEITF